MIKKYRNFSEGVEFIDFSRIFEWSNTSDGVEHLKKIKFDLDYIRDFFIDMEDDFHLEVSIKSNSSLSHDISQSVVRGPVVLLSHLVRIDISPIPELLLNGDINDLYIKSKEISDLILAISECSTRFSKSEKMTCSFTTSRNRNLISLLFKSVNPFNDNEIFQAYSKWFIERKKILSNVPKSEETINFDLLSSAIDDFFGIEE